MNVQGPAGIFLRREIISSLALLGVGEYALVGVLIRVFWRSVTRSEQSFILIQTFMVAVSCKANIFYFFWLFNVRLKYFKTHYFLENKYHMLQMV